MQISILYLCFFIIELHSFRDLFFYLEIFKMFMEFLFFYEKRIKYNHHEIIIILLCVQAKIHYSSLFIYSFLFEFYRFSMYQPKETNHDSVQELINQSFIIKYIKLKKKARLSHSNYQRINIVIQFKFVYGILLV